MTEHHLGCDEDRRSEGEKVGDTDRDDETCAHGIPMLGK